MNQASPTSASEVAGNLVLVRERIAAASRAAGRDPATVELVAVSKTHPGERVRAALAAGHRVFGENRVQEAQRKYPPPRSIPVKSRRRPAYRRRWPTASSPSAGPNSGFPSSA